MLLKKNLQCYGLRDTTLYLFKSYPSPYPVRWIRRSSFGKETYRSRCATRFNIGSFVLCYVHECYANWVIVWTFYMLMIRHWQARYVFTQEVNHDVNHMSYLINLELPVYYLIGLLLTNSLWTLTKFMIFHNHQKWYRLTISLAQWLITRWLVGYGILSFFLSFFFFFFFWGGGAKINEFVNWSSHSLEIANKISRALGIMNRFKRHMPKLHLLWCWCMTHLYFPIYNLG